MTLSKFDAVRLSKTMAFLLRHKPEAGGLNPDENGWVPIENLCSAAGRLLRYEIKIRHVTLVVTEVSSRRFELVNGRVRALQEEQRGQRPPDILYHATCESRIEGFIESGEINPPPGKQLYLSVQESQAWRAAHRASPTPHVLYVDAGRAARAGIPFCPSRYSGLWQAPGLKAKHVLNLQPRFDFQLSAGGIPIRKSANGMTELALVKVVRRGRGTWEVAKGKLETGETPESAAMREVCEELGVDASLHVERYVDTIRYGFTAPGSKPRLKSVFLYLLTSTERLTDFHPALDEGITEVAWFTPNQARRAVVHPSLRPAMRKVQHLLERNPPKFK